MSRFPRLGALVPVVLAAASLRSQPVPTGDSGPGADRAAPAARATPEGASPDVVLEWNATTLRTTAAAPFNPPLESRNVAIVHAAMFDAVNSIVGEFEAYAVGLRPAAGASPEAAAAAAAHLALVRLYPARQVDLDAAYAASLEAIPDGPGREAGIATGEAAAARILAIRANDGADAAIVAPYAPGARPGDWNPAPPAFRPALDPGWGSVKPFFLASGSQFRPGPPPPLESRRYARDFIEIKDAGSIASSTRTGAETDLARFWVATAPQNWNPAARQAVLAKRLSLSQSARLFALLNAAGADAVIACWDAKYTFNEWRPVTAIRGAEMDANPETVADPSWTPLLATPPFPDFPAGHTAYAGAAEEVLERVFGEDPGIVMTLTSPTAPGVVETYRTFGEIASDVVDARVWGGVHWRTSSLQGRELGARVGRYAVDNFLRRTTPGREGR